MLKNPRRTKLKLNNIKAGLQLSNIIINDPEIRQKFKDGDKLVGFLNPLSIAAMQAAYEEGEEWLTQMDLYVDENFRYVKSFIDENLPEIKFEIAMGRMLDAINKAGGRK